MDLQGLGAPIAAVIVALTGFFGLLFKRSYDRRTATDAASKADKELENAARKTQSALEAKRAGEVYDQMQEDRERDRAEIRAMREDLNRMNTEMTGMWSKMSAMRRAVTAYEAHIAEWKRWADAGASGPQPTPLQPMVIE